MIPMDRHTVQERRRALIAQLPALSARVFAVRFGRTPLMKALGALMQSCCDYDKPYPHTVLLVDEVILEDLVDQVTACEGQVVPA
jgi:hypothetical protein